MSSPSAGASVVISPTFFRFSRGFRGAQGREGGEEEASNHSSHKAKYNVMIYKSPGIPLTPEKSSAVFSQRGIGPGAGEARLDLPRGFAKGMCCSVSRAAWRGFKNFRGLFQGSRTDEQRAQESDVPGTLVNFQPFVSVFSRQIPPFTYSSISAILRRGSGHAFLAELTSEDTPLCDAVHRPLSPTTAATS